LNEIQLFNLIVALVVSPVKEELCSIFANVAAAGALKGLKESLERVFTWYEQLKKVEHGSGGLE
jgi:hypothetical protein